MASQPSKWTKKRDPITLVTLATHRVCDEWRLSTASNFIFVRNALGTGYYKKKDPSITLISNCKGQYRLGNFLLDIYFVLSGYEEVSWGYRSAGLFNILVPTERTLLVVILRRLELLSVFLAPAARENILRIGVHPEIVRVGITVKMQAQPISCLSIPFATISRQVL